MAGSRTVSAWRCSTGFRTFRTPQVCAQSFAPSLRSLRTNTLMDSSKTVTAERGRYHLYISHACPYSARAVLARCVKQLEDVVSMSALDPVRGPEGWMFGGGEYADLLNGFRSLREAYEANDPGYEGRVSVPVLW